MNPIGNFTGSAEKDEIMVRLTGIRSFVFALMVALTIAASAALPPTKPQLPPSLQDRGIIWGN